VEDGLTWRRVNLCLAAGWTAMVPVAIITGWLYSLAFISAVSVYANAASHLAAWRADVPDTGAGS
jgi:hypothetical protein